MQGKNHVALALAIPLGAAMAAGSAVLPASAAGWAGLIIGSLAPDIDGGGHIAYWGNLLPRGITPRPLVALLNGLGKTVSDVIRAVFGHRKAFHWPIIGLTIMGAGLLLGLDWLAWAGVGYVLHIAGDALTKSGVPLFGPLWGGDISLTPMVTGKFVESAFGVLLWLFVGWRVVASLPKDGYVLDLLYRFGSAWL